MLKRLASNAGANIFSGVVAAAYQLTITAIGSAVWHGAEFASWALALSVAAIAPLFSLNLSSVVTRRIVEARHSVSRSSESAIVLSARRIAVGLSLGALTLLAVAGVLVQAQSALGAVSTGAFAALLGLLLIANSWLLLWQVRFGKHFADEKNWLPALSIAFARAGGVLGLSAAVANGGHSLLSAGFGLCAGTWVGLGVAQVLVLRTPWRLFTGPRPEEAEIHRQYHGNLRLLAGFAVGSTSMLVIQYSVPPLMAVIAPEQFNAFYLASTLNTVAVGVLAAAMSATLAPFTRWHARGDTTELRRIALLSPVLCSGACLVILVLCWLALGPALQLLDIRVANTSDIRSFLALLGFQTIIRNAAAGYAMYIASAGSSKQISAPLIIEIALAFSIAIPLGWFFGEYALLVGLSMAGLIGSLYSSKVMASLRGAYSVSLRTAFPCLLGAQAVFCLLWWAVIRLSAV